MGGAVLLILKTLLSHKTSAHTKLWIISNLNFKHPWPHTSRWRSERGGGLSECVGRAAGNEDGWNAPTFSLRSRTQSRYKACFCTLGRPPCSQPWWHQLLIFDVRRHVLTRWVIQSQHNLYPPQSFTLFSLFLQMWLSQNVKYFHCLICYVCPFHQWIIAPAIRLSAGKMQTSLYCF